EVLIVRGSPSELLDLVRRAIPDSEVPRLAKPHLRAVPPPRPSRRLDHRGNEVRLEILERERIAERIEHLLDERRRLLARQPPKLLAPAISQREEAVVGDHPEDRVDGVDRDPMVLLLLEVDTDLLEERIDLEDLAEPPARLMEDARARHEAKEPIEPFRRSARVRGVAEP